MNLLKSLDDLDLEDPDTQEDESYKTVTDFSSLLSTLTSNRRHEIMTIIKSLSPTNDDPFREKTYDTFIFYEAFFKLYNLTIRTTPTNEELRLFIKYKFHKLVYKMLDYYNKICLEIDFKAEDILSTSENVLYEETNENQRRVYIFTNLVTILNQLLFKLVSFNLEFLTEPDLGLSSLFSLVNNEKLFQTLNEKNLKLLSSIVNSLKSLSIFYAHNEQIKQAWVQSKIGDRFVVIAQNLKTFKIVRQVYLIIAQISDEDTVQGLPEINQVIKSLCSDMNSFCNLFKTSSHIERIPIELMSKWLLDEDELKTSNDLTINEYQITFLNGKSLIHVLNDLNKLAIDPILKHRIWDAQFSKNSLKYLIINANEIEKLFALKLFGQLCRNELVVDYLVQDEVFRNSIEMLSKNKKNQIGEIRVVSKKINDLIKKQEFPIGRYVIGVILVAGFILERFMFMRNV